MSWTPQEFAFTRETVEDIGLVIIAAVSLALKFAI